MLMNSEFLKEAYFGNPVSAYLISAIIFLVSAAILKIFEIIIVKRIKKFAEKTKTQLDDFLVKHIEKSIVPILYISALYFAQKNLEKSPEAVQIIYSIFIIIFAFYCIKFLSSILNFMFKIYWRKKNPGEEGSFKGFSSFINILLWTIGIIFVLDNLGFEISAVLAGLGIGGIAIALASQAVLGDLFSYFVIFFDKPFQIGDFITIENKSGTIENIGIKTTKIRSLNGEMIIISNKDLTNSIVHNFKRMERRRVVFSIGITYQTSHSALMEIPEIIEKIIREVDNTEFDRAHFKEYGDFSLNFEIVYFVLSPDYKIYMDIQQVINFLIHREFEKRKIDFAYPTQTVFLQSNK